jgi:peptidoglycan/LPS O-acetylase OafA/YrhL
MAQSIHLKGLNGIRAIAAISVVLFHTSLSLDLFGLDPYIIWGKLENNKPQGFRMGSYAVTVFFTLSGFLITYLLLKEQQIREINLKNFYIRRALRILPLYFLVLVFSLIIYKLIDVPFSKSIVLYYLFFLANIPATLERAISHMGFYWSLGVEEQFYLVWPLFIKLSKSRYLKNAILLLLLFFLLRGLFWLLKLNDPDYEIFNKFLGLNRYHNLITGGVAAMLFIRQDMFFIRFFTNKYVVVIAWIILFLPSLKAFRAPAFHEIVSLSTVAIIISQITAKNKWVNLENKVMDFLGRISYGIYMTHSIIIVLLSKLIGKFADQSTLNYIFIFAIVPLITIVISTILYHYFESWFLNLKKRFAFIQDPGINKS